MSNRIKLIPLAILILLTGWALYLNWSPIEIIQADDTVSITATVSTSVSCTSLPDGASAFGTITTTAIATSTPWATTTMSCNYAAGCTLKVNDAGDTSNPGLYASDAVDIIGSATAAFADTATLVAGTEGYGIKGATTSAGTGQELLMQNPRYNRYNLGGFYSTQVGGLELAAGIQGLASSTAPVSGRQVEVIHLAAIDGLIKASNNYADTISYSCVGN